MGFVDDNPALRRRRIQGVTVIGASDELSTLLAVSAPTEVLVTIPHAPPAVIDGIARTCTDSGVPCRLVQRQVEAPPALAGVPAE